VTTDQAEVVPRELSEPEPDFGTLGPEELEPAIDLLRRTLEAANVEDEEIKKSVQMLNYAETHRPDKPIEYAEMNNS
jgi:hypothetical protein